MAKWGLAVGSVVIIRGWGLGEEKGTQGRDQMGHWAGLSETSRLRLPGPGPPQFCTLAFPAESGPDVPGEGHIGFA